MTQKNRMEQHSKEAVIKLIDAMIVKNQVQGVIMGRVDNKGKGS